MKINVDLDGVVVDFCQGFIQMLHEHDSEQFPLDSLPYPTQWNWWPEWNMSQGEWMSWFRKGVESGQIWRDAPMIQGASACLWQLSDADHHIRIVTHRLGWQYLHAVAIKTTVDWLEAHNIPYRDIAFEGAKTEIEADVIIDDKPDLSWVQPGKVNILFDRPYNQNISIATKGGFIRAFGWPDVMMIVGDLEHQGWVLGGGTV